MARRKGISVKGEVLMKEVWKKASRVGARAGGAGMEGRSEAVTARIPAEGSVGSCVRGFGMRTSWDEDANDLVGEVLESWF